MMRIGRYCRTVRHLKLRQIIGRVVFSLGARLPARGAAPPRRPACESLVLPARRGQSLVAPERFTFLNQERSLDDAGWDSPQVERLWRYNLHYFDDLNAAGADSRRDWQTALVSRWIAENPGPLGTGWEPFPTSLRVVNWIKWLLAGPRVEDEWLNSLVLQVRWLERRIEWHLLGNHLLANAKALCIAGLYFSGPEADRWRERGVAILRQELKEQVLQDGGHFERSPMYHLLVLEDVLDLLTFIRCFGAPDSRTAALREQLRECAERMLGWADVMRYDGGELPGFNDTAGGIAPSYPELLRLAEDLDLSTRPCPGDAVQLLADSGYARLCWSDAKAFLDVAPVGPDYLPGHAHADTLSFELAIAGRQVVVNRGTSCYGLSDRRAYERSTAAQSTVEVDGQSSSEVWGGFRVGRRAYPRDLQVTRNGVACAHDGYRFLPGRPLHSRVWAMLPRGLHIEDSVSGGRQAISRFHLAPGLVATRESPATWHISSADRLVAKVEFSSELSRVVPGEHAVGFGMLVPAQTIELELERGRASARWSW